MSTERNFWILSGSWRRRRSRKKICKTSYFLSIVSQLTSRTIVAKNIILWIFFVHAIWIWCVAVKTGWRRSKRNPKKKFKLMYAFFKRNHRSIKKSFCKENCKLSTKSCANCVLKSCIVSRLSNICCASLYLHTRRKQIDAIYLECFAYFIWLVDASKRKTSDSELTVHFYALFSKRLLS